MLKQSLHYLPYQEVREKKNCVDCYDATVTNRTNETVDVDIKQKQKIHERDNSAFFAKLLNVNHFPMKST